MIEHERACASVTHGHPCDCVSVAELRAALAKEKERADEWARVARERGQKLAIAGVEGSPPPGQDTTIGVLTSRLAAERQRVEKAEKCLDIYEANLESLRAEVERLKARNAELFPNAVAAIGLRATLAEREAEIERLKAGTLVDKDWLRALTEDNGTLIRDIDEARAALASRERDYMGQAVEIGVLRAALDTARAETLEEAAKVVEERKVRQEELLRENGHDIHAHSVGCLQGAVWDIRALKAKG